MTEDMDY